MGNFLIKKYKPLMRKALQRAKKLDLEHGFNVCRDLEGGLYLANDEICVGDRCGVDFKKCNSALMFHTHPVDTGTEFSDGDIYVALQVLGRGGIGCVSAPSSDSDVAVVKCYGEGDGLWRKATKEEIKQGWASEQYSDEAQAYFKLWETSSLMNSMMIVKELYDLRNGKSNLMKLVDEFEIKL